MTSGARVPVRLVIGLAVAIALDTGLQLVWKTGIADLPDSASVRETLVAIALNPIFILVAASIKAWWEIDLASRFGPQVLGPMDMGGLILGDLVHLLGACVGGWLSDLQRPGLERPRP